MPADKPPSRRFVIWGSAGHALVLGPMLHAAGHAIVALVDNDPAAVSVFPGVPLLHGRRALEEFVAAHGHDGLAGAIAIGGSRGRDRREILQLFAALGCETPALIHPLGFVCETATVGEGTHVLARATVAAAASVGAACIVNHGAIVDHECRLGAGTHIAPGATLCGCVVTGEDVFVGAGAVVLPRLTLGRGCVVGAGAVVTREIPDFTTVVGNPARTMVKAVRTDT